MKHLEKITPLFPDFRLSDIRYILDFRYHLEMRYLGLHDLETIPLVDLKGLIIGKEKNYEVHIRFCGVVSLSMDLGYHGNHVFLNLVDHEEEDGWEKKYEVYEVEDEYIRFLCDEIEIISVEESEISVKHTWFE